MRPESGCSFGVAFSARLVAREREIVTWMHVLTRFRWLSGLFGNDVRELFGKPNAGMGPAMALVELVRIGSQLVASRSVPIIAPYVR